MVVCRMGDGSLLVHSPVELDRSLAEGLAALGGGVGHIVSPNYEHLKYAQQWAEVFPDAQIHGCPGLPARMPGVAWTSELGATRPADWESSVDSVWFDCEVNPFTGAPFFNEVVFFHEPSKALFCADAWWNYPAGESPNLMGAPGAEGTGSVHECSKVPVPGGVARLPPVPVPVGTLLWKFGMDQVYLPFYKRFMVGGSGSRRRVQYEAAVSRVLAWAPEVLVPCHGDVVRGSEACRRELERHFLG